MEKTRTILTWGSFLLLLLLLFVFLIWNVLAGSVKLPVSEILEILRGRGDGTQSRILLQIRLPRLLSALILGGALSVSGYLLQTFFHNPIAGPFVLGISSGAKLCVSIVMILLLSRGLVSSSAALIAAAFVGYCFIGQYFLTTHADYNVAVVAPHYLPEATQTALQDALAAYGEDRNGDGKVVVKLNVYTMNFGSDDSDAYLDMAGTTKLSTDIQGVLSSIFILYDPAGFQSTTGTLRYLDGSLPQSDADNDWWNMVYHWDDCPVLAGLDLGDYTSDAVQNDSGSSQELLSHYYIGIRGAWTKDAADLLSGGEALWQALTAGAVSTVTKEG